MNTLAERFDFDVIDATKIIPEEEVPTRRVGRLVLDRCVDNFFAETWRRPHLCWRTLACRIPKMSI
jgi:catalase